MDVQMQTDSEHNIDEHYTPQSIASYGPRPSTLSLHVHTHTHTLFTPQNSRWFLQCMRHANSYAQLLLAVATASHGQSEAREGDMMQWFWTAYHP